MVHTLTEAPLNNDGELKRITSLEYRVNELENKLLKESMAALEKRVEELESELKASNDECQMLNETVTRLENAAKEHPFDQVSDECMSELEKRVEDLENASKEPPGYQTTPPKLEKRIEELESELKASNEECQMLNRTVTRLENAAKEYEDDQTAISELEKRIKELKAELKASNEECQTLNRTVARLENGAKKYKDDQTIMSELEKRVEELELELTASNEKCHMLNETVVCLENVVKVHQGDEMTMSELEKRVKELESALEEACEERGVLHETVARLEKSAKEHQADQEIKKESNAIFEDESEGEYEREGEDEDEDIYGRVLVLISNMKSQCIRAINLKITTSSRLPMFATKGSHSGKASAPQSPALSPTKLGPRSRTPSIPSRPSTPTSTTAPSLAIVTPSASATSLPHSHAHSHSHSAAAGIPVKHGIPRRSSTMSLNGNSSRPTTPVPSSPLCSPTQSLDVPLPSSDGLEYSLGKAHAIPIRRGSACHGATGSSSRPMTPVSSSPLVSSPIMYYAPPQNQLSSSPPSSSHSIVSYAAEHAPVKEQVQEVAFKHTGIPTRARASSYSVINSRPSSPFRSTTMHSLSRPEKVV